MLYRTVPLSTSRNGRCGKPPPYGGTFDGSSEPYSACLSPVHQARARAAHCGPAPGSWLPQRAYMGLLPQQTSRSPVQNLEQFASHSLFQGNLCPYLTFSGAGGTRAVPPDGFPECLKEHG